MCGISGYISRNRITEEELRIMNDTMIHRGPNDSGVEIYPFKDGYNIGFECRSGETGETHGTQNSARRYIVGPNPTCGTNFKCIVGTSAVRQPSKLK